MNRPPFELPIPPLARWRQGNTGIAGVWRFESSRPGPHVLVTALLHGNELCGAWALHDLLNLLHHGGTLCRGTLTLALCNLAAFDRFDASRPDEARFVEEDMNRIWSDVKAQTLSTCERRRAAELRPIVAQADCLLDLHSMHEPGEPLLLTGALPRDLAFARCLDAPGHMVVDAGHADGVRLRDHGRFGDPLDERAQALLVECGYHGDLASASVARDIARRVLLHHRMMKASDFEPSWQLPRKSQPWTLRVTDAVVARTQKLRFEPIVKPLAVIPRAGTIVAYDDRAPVRTPYDDCVLVMPSLRQLRPNVTVMRLARREDA